MKSWKTTAAGIIAGLMIILSGASAVLDDNPETTLNIEQVLAGVSTILLSVGLTAARDNSVTSEQAGAKKRTTVGKTGLAVLLCFALLGGGVGMTGCASFPISGTERDQYDSIEQNFGRVVLAVHVLQRMDVFDYEQNMYINAAILSGEDYLAEWGEALDAGQSRPDIASALTKLLDELLGFEKTGKAEKAASEQAMLESRPGLEDYREACMNLDAAILLVEMYAQAGEYPDTVTADAALLIEQARGALGEWWLKEIPGDTAQMIRYVAMLESVTGTNTRI